MQNWLIKSEITEWSWEMQVVKGVMREPQTGVRGYQAQDFLKQMKPSDKFFTFNLENQIKSFWSKLSKPLSPNKQLHSIDLVGDSHGA